MKIYKYPSATISRLQKQNERLEQAKMVLSVYLWDSESAAITINEISSAIIANCKEIEQIERKGTKQ